MTIESRVTAVEALYSQLEIEISKFQSHTKLHCAAGCGKCCTKPDIDASPLEFLPWAFHLFMTGKAEETLETLKERSNTQCFLYNPVSLLGGDNGSCGHYKYRGLICRLFGYGASRDKIGQLRLATCKIIKEGQQENYLKASDEIGKDLYVPIFTDYYMNLSQIDFKLGNIILPINQAFIMAIEEVLQYYAYRPFPGGLKITA